MLKGQNLKISYRFDGFVPIEEVSELKERECSNLTNDRQLLVLIVIGLLIVIG